MLDNPIMQLLRARYGLQGKVGRPGIGIGRSGIRFNGDDEDPWTWPNPAPRPRPPWNPTPLPPGGLGPGGIRRPGANDSRKKALLDALRARLQA